MKANKFHSIGAPIRKRETESSAPLSTRRIHPAIPCVYCASAALLPSENSTLSNQSQSRINLATQIWLLRFPLALWFVRVSVYACARMCVSVSVTSYHYFFICYFLFDFIWFLLFFCLLDRWFFETQEGPFRSDLFAAPLRMSAVLGPSLSLTPSEQLWAC